MKIFYPYLLEGVSPIKTIFEEVGSRQPNHVCGLRWAKTPAEEVSIPTLPIQRPIEKRIIGYLRAYLRNWGVIHTGPAFHSLLALLNIPGTRLVHTYHNCEELKEEVRTSAIFRRKISAKYFDVITAVSPFVADVIEEEYGRRPVVIPNGTDHEQFYPARAQTKNDLYVFIGRLVKNKNPELIVRLARENPKKNFNILGDGPLRSKLESFSDTLSNLYVFGEVSRDLVADQLASAQATLCPFEREGFGMVIIESLASGTPVMGLADGNIPNLIHSGKNGYLVNSLRVNVWENQLDRVESLDQQTVRASSFKYNWDRIASKYGQIYQNGAV